MMLSEPGLPSKRSSILAVSAFLLGLIVLASMIFPALRSFPVYFFCDEASPAVTGAQWISRYFSEARKSLIPPIYHEIAPSRSVPFFSAYVQFLAVSLFGWKVEVTRAINGAVGIAGVLALALMARNYLRLSLWWLTPLLFACTPIWLIHARTAFDNVMSLAFQAMFLLAYLAYRFSNPRWALIAAPLWAMSFYTYSSSQVTMPVLAIALFLSDFRYHLKNLRSVVPALLLLLVLMAPALEFAWHKGREAVHGQFQSVSPTMASANVGISSKLLHVGSNYLKAVSPGYLVDPEASDLTRHKFLGQGHFRLEIYVLGLLGVLVAALNFRNPIYRVFLLWALILPLPAALTEVGISRIIPLTNIFALGAVVAFQPLLNRERAVSLLCGAVFFYFAALSIWLRQEMLTNGPKWFPEYGFYGMQFGSTQVFGEEVPKLLAASPNASVIVSGSWANGIDVFPPFFLTPEQRERTAIVGPRSYVLKFIHIPEGTVFILTPDDLKDLIASQLFEEPQIISTIFAPDSKPAFLSVVLKYKPNAKELFAEYRAQRAKLREQAVLINDNVATLSYSLPDMGEPAALFDNDPYTLMRGLEANPYVLELKFKTPIKLRELNLNLAGDAFVLKVRAMNAAGTAVNMNVEPVQPAAVDQLYALTNNDKTQAISFIRVEIFSPHEPDEAHIHVRGLEFVND